MASQPYLPENYSVSQADHQRYNEGIRRLLERAGLRYNHARDDVDSDLASSDAESESESMAETVASTSTSLYEHLKAQEEWEENVRQLQLVMSVFVVPSIGKYLGRKWAFSIYANYISFGWKWRTFIPDTLPFLPGSGLLPSWLRG